MHFVLFCFEKEKGKGKRKGEGKKWKNFFLRYTGM